MSLRTEDVFNCSSTICSQFISRFEPLAHVSVLLWLWKLTTSIFFYKTQYLESAAQGFRNGVMALLVKQSSDNTRHMLVWRCFTHKSHISSGFGFTQKAHSTLNTKILFVNFIFSHRFCWFRSQWIVKIVKLWLCENMRCILRIGMCIIHIIHLHGEYSIVLMRVYGVCCSVYVWL